MKNIIILILIITLVGLSLLFTMNSSANFESEIESDYHTLKGQIYAEGTGEMSMLIFKSNYGNYLISNRGDLNNLKGLPLLLTGKVNKSSQGPYQGQIKVTHYNTYYDKAEEDNEESSVLGKLVKGKTNLVLLTPDQIVINLDPDTYHSLKDHTGSEVVINGSLNKTAKYKGQMEVKSYRIIN